MLILLAFLIPLELLLDIGFNLETILKPYRIIQLCLIIYFVASTGLSFCRFSPFTSYFVWFISAGLFATVLRYSLERVDSFLLFNWLGISVINILSFLIVSFVVIPVQKLKMAYIAFFCSLLLNLVLIVFSPKEEIFRVSGFFDNSNSLGIAAILGVILAIESFERKWISWFVLYPLLLAFFLLVNESGSRAALLVFVTVFVLLFFSKSRGMLILLLGVLIGSFYYTPAVYDDLEINALKRQTSKEIRGEDEIRLALAAGALDAAHDTYYLGLGISQFQNIDNFYKYIYPINRSIAWERREKGTGLVSHSTFIQVFAEFGIIGLVVFVLLIVKIFNTSRMNFVEKPAFFLSNKKLLIVVAMLVFSITHVVLLNPLFWFFVGLACNRNLATVVKNGY